MQEITNANSDTLDKLFNTPKKLIKYLFHLAIENNYSVALWKMPNETELNLLINFTDKPSVFNQQVGEHKEGFVFTSFDKKNALFLNADLHLNIGKVKESQKDQLSKIINSHKPIKANLKYHISPNKTQETKPEEFIKNVKEAICSIENSEFEKVVISKIKKLELKSDFEALEAFYKLTKKYTTAFTSLVSIPKVGTWMGASPETLVSYKNNIFKTVALAGTKKIEPNTRLNDVSWKIKEIEEQAMVSRYIIDCFKKIRLREFEEHGPKTIQAGSLAHLCTEFDVFTDKLDFTELPQTMLKLLHPTSAVCGMPKEKAMNFISSKEKHSRQFFSGFLGPCYIEKKTHLFVNLRCTELSNNEAILYAGAGITASSEPEKEWIETENKCLTIMDAL